MFKVFRLVNRSLALFTSVYPEVSGGPLAAPPQQTVPMWLQPTSAEAMQKEQRVEQPQAGVKIQVLVPTHLECVPVGRLGLIFGDVLQYRQMLPSLLGSQLVLPLKLKKHTSYISYILYKNILLYHVYIYIYI